MFEKLMSKSAMASSATRPLFLAMSLYGATAVAGLAPAFAQGIDTTILPRLPAVNVVYAGPTSTIYISPNDVERTAEAVTKLLTAADWQPYGDPFSASAPSAQMRIMNFKKGPQAINVFINIAPAQGNATTVSYTGVPLSNDLPFPKGASEIGFAPDRPHLRAVSADPVPMLLDFFRKEMGALGYQPWTVKPDQVSDRGALTFFTRDNQKIMVLSLSRNDEGRTRIEISAVSASTLTAEAKPTPPAETPEQAAARAAAREQHERASAAIDNQINAQIGQVLQDVQKSLRSPPTAAQRSSTPVTALQARNDNATPISVPETANNVTFEGGTLEFESGSDVRSLAAFHNAEMKKGGWSARRPSIDRDNMVVVDFAKAGKTVSFTIMQFGNGTRVRASGSGLASASAQSAGNAAATPVKPAEVSADDLIVEEAAGYPVPKRRSSSGSERTPYRLSINARVPMDVATMLDFYRRELIKRGWTETSGATVAPTRANVSFTAPEGPAVLVLDRKGDETAVTLTLRKTEEAKQAGVLPKPGQARVVIGNPGDSEAVLTINKQTFRVKPGVGAKKPDGPMLDLPPGKYQASLKMGNKTVSEPVEVAADETWGVLIGPGGLLVLQVY